MNTLTTFLEAEIIRVNDYTLTVLDVISAIGLICITWLLLFVLQRILLRKNRIGRLDAGNTYALMKIVKYIVWVIAIVFILESLGVKFTLLLAGSAALLVGIGLGLQQTFNDILSGIILLSERSIKVDDILEIDGDIIKIQEIGLRTSKGLNRDEISIIIPNSLITTNKVINWSHQARKTRFRIGVGLLTAVM